MAWTDVGEEGAQAPGTLRRVVVEGTALVVVRSETGWSALVDTCPHAGAPLSEGALRGDHVVCSWHGWRFDARTGACPLFPGAPGATPRAVRVENGRVLVDDGRG